MSKEKRVVDYYVLCNKLKDVVRTGWKNWGVKRFRVESIAEHIFGVQMLAISMWAEYEYDFDIMKVITMLAVHESEEIIIGDMTCFEITREEKRKQGHEAVIKIFESLLGAEKIKELIFEFDERKTQEAKFAYYCDKLECDLQAKLYDEQNCVDLNNQVTNKTAENEDVKRYLESGMSWGEMWMSFGQERYGYDENFLAVSNYAKDNKILNNN